MDEQQILEALKKVWRAEFIDEILGEIEPDNLLEDDGSEFCEGYLEALTDVRNVIEKQKE